VDGEEVGDSGEWGRRETVENFRKCSKTGPKLVVDNFKHVRFFSPECLIHASFLEWFTSCNFSDDPLALLIKEQNTLRS
jgi:hypothetical protein